MRASPRSLWIALFACNWVVHAEVQPGQLSPAQHDTRASIEGSAGWSCVADRKSANGIMIRETTLRGVPAILRMPSVVTEPPVLLWHGFGPPETPSDLMKALPLDEVPAVKVYLGLPLLGTRAPPGGSEEIGRRQAQDYVTLLFEPSVIGAANELPGIADELKVRQCLGATEGIGLFGFSAGGSAVLIALAEKRVRVRAAVVVNAPANLESAIAALEHATGRKYQWTPRSARIAERADAVRRSAAIGSDRPPPALLVFHGADDSIVTPNGATALGQALRPFYHDANYDERLRVTIAPGVSHKWTDPAAVDAVRASVADWFNRFMREPAPAQR